MKLEGLPLPDLHDFCLRAFEWDGHRHLAMLRFALPGEPQVVIELDGVDDLRINEMVAMNIVGDVTCVPITEAGDSFWKNLLGTIVPGPSIAKARKETLKKLNQLGWAISIEACYGGSFWIVCRTGHWSQQL